MFNQKPVFEYADAVVSVGNSGMLQYVHISVVLSVQMSIHYFIVYSLFYSEYILYFKRIVLGCI